MKFLNTLNRIVIVIVCLVLILVLTSIFILPQLILTSVGDWMAEWGAYLGRQTPWLRAIIGALLALIVDFILAVAIFLEVRPTRKRYINVQQVAGGMANVSIESVNQLLNHKLDPLPGVIKVNPRIRAKGDKVEAIVDAEVARDANVPTMANQMIKVIQAALTEELGLQIAGQPQVRVNVTDQTTVAVKQPRETARTKSEKQSPAKQAHAEKAGGGPPPLPWTSSESDKTKNEGTSSNS